MEEQVEHEHPYGKPNDRNDEVVDKDHGLYGEYHEDDRQYRLHTEFNQRLEHLYHLLRLFFVIYNLYRV